MTRVLVTGASGFIGRHVVKQGLEAGCEVHGLSRGPSPGISHEIDLLDAQAVARIVSEIAPEGVIHCAAPGVTHGSMSADEMKRVAVEGTRHLYDACAALPKPPRIVHVGSGFENSDSPYGAAKAAAGELAAGYADRMDLAIVRPYHVYGAGEGPNRLGPFIIKKARERVPIPLTGGEQVRDFLEVSDCARALWTMLAEMPPGLTALELGCGRPITLRTYVEALAAALETAGIPADLQFGVLPYRADDPMVSVPDLTRTFEVLSWRPQVSLLEGIARLVAAELK